MKRFIALLVVLAGGLAAAWFVVPSNAVTVNGSAITQKQLNADVAAIAGSPAYECFLNGEELVGTQGQTPAPTVSGVGQTSASAAHTTANTAFVATYLDTSIGQQLIFQLAAQRGVAITAQDLTTGRTALLSQINQIYQTVNGVQGAACTSATGQPETAAGALASLPSPFVANEVRFQATLTRLENTLTNFMTTAGLQRYFAAHLGLFINTCFTFAEYTSASDAQAAAAKVAAGTPFSQVAAAAASGSGPQGCQPLYGIQAQLPSTFSLGTLPLNTLSAPVAVSGGYLLFEVTLRTPTTFAQAKPEVKVAAQNAGSVALRTLLTDQEKRAAVSVNPQYGTWHSNFAQVLVPVPPPKVNVLNRAANTPVPSSGGSSSSAAGSG